MINMCQSYLMITAHVCEAMVVVLCYVTGEWAIKQKVCHLMLLAKCLAGEDLVVLSAELGILISSYCRNM